MKVLLAVTDAAVRFAKWSAITASAVMAIMILLQVLFRYVIGSSLSFSEELARFLFIWSVAMGSALALRSRSHIGVEIFVEMLPKRLEEQTKVIGTVLNLVFFGLLIWYGFEMVVETMDQESAALELPMGYVYLAIPLSGIVLFICEIANFAEDRFGSRPQTTPANEGVKK